MKRSALLALWVFAFFWGVAAQAEEGLEKGIQFLDEQRWAEARQFFESVVEKNSNHSLATFYLGRVFFHQEDYDRAIVLFGRAVELQEGHADYHLWLGRAYGRRAERASVFKQFFLARKVRKHFERAIALDPDNRAARFDLAQYYLLAPRTLGGGKEKAKEQAREIKKRNLPQGHEIWGMVYEAEDQHQQAEEEYLAAIDLDPNNLDVYYQLASLYEKTGQEEKAFEMLEKLLVLDPNHKEAKTALAKLNEGLADKLQ